MLATPQVYLFDQDRKLRYVGRIDDSDVQTVTSHDARNAIDAAAGRQAGASREDARFRLLDQMVRQASRSGEVARAGRRRAGRAQADRRGGPGAAGARTTPTSCCVVNVWATWCGPCVAEMPEFVTMNRMYRKRNFQMVTISIDEPEQKDAALKLLKENHASTTNYISAIANATSWPTSSTRNGKDRFPTPC